MVKTRSVALLMAFGLALGAPVLPARAQDSGSESPSDRIAESNEEMVEYWRSVADDPDSTPQQREQALRNIYEQENRHAGDQTRTKGAAQHVDRVAQMMEHDDASREHDLERQRLENERLAAQIEREKAEAEAAKPPGFWDKVGDALLDVGKNMLNQAGSKFVDNLFNPDKGSDAENQALIDELTRLQDEYDRLDENRNDTGNGLGTVITDPTGTYGYDRDGDGYVDIPINGDGSTGSYNPTNPYAYGDDFASGNGGGLGNLITDSDGNYGFDRDGDGRVDIPLPNPDKDDPLLAGGGGGGGPSFGGGMGAGSGGMPGMPGGAMANAEGEEGEDGEDSIPGVGGTSGEENGLAAGPGAAAAGGGATVKGGALAADGKPLSTFIGRVVVVPKLEFEDLAGNRKAEANPSETWEDEWADDGWDDATDNGDWGDDWADDGWGDDEWGKKPNKGSGAKGGKSGKDADAAAELVDQIIRVETVIAEWRKQEQEGQPYGEEDPYGFQDDGMSGYQAAGASEKDPFKEVRDRDGKIDLSKVELWVISRDTWKDGKEPVRYKVKLDPEVKDLEPVHGGVLVVRGVERELDLERRVLDEIKGQVKELEVVQVILSAEKPPADMESLDPDAAPADGDKGVGGLSEDEMGSFDEGW